MPITNKDIARLAGVSPSTVTKVMNDYPDVSPATRQRIQDIIKQQGYEPHFGARAIQGKWNHIFGLLLNAPSGIDIAELSQSPFYTHLIMASISEVVGIAYSVLPIFTKDNCDTVQYYLNSRLIDGALLIGYEWDHDILNRLLQSEAHLVLIDELEEIPPDSRNVSLINIDNYRGAYLATQYLIETGHTRIVHVMGDPQRIPALRRLEGYKQALMDGGFAVAGDESLIFRGKFNSQTGYEALQYFCESAVEFDSFFCANDDIALGVLQAARNLGYEVPRDFSLIGFDDLPQANVQSLSSVRVEIRDLVQLAIRQLYKQITQGSSAIRVTLPVSLMKRKSVALRL
ncbi:MAG: LacI family DNA-binding transcriptional regulator [Spirochaetota bacterium]